MIREGSWIVKLNTRLTDTLADESWVSCHYLCFTARFGCCNAVPAHA